jgi:hypothetical protein
MIQRPWRRSGGGCFWGSDLRFLSGAKGIRTPTLTRGNAVLAAVSLRLVPIQSR